jgi:hypothetical protein
MAWFENPDVAVDDCQVVEIAELHGSSPISCRHWHWNMLMTMTLKSTWWGLQVCWWLSHHEDCHRSKKCIDSAVKDEQYLFTNISRTDLGTGCTVFNHFLKPQVCFGVCSRDRSAVPFARYLVPLGRYRPHPPGGARCGTWYLFFEKIQQVPRYRYGYLPK